MAKACFSCDAFNGPSATRPQLRRHHRRHPQCRSMSSTSGSSGWRWCYIVSRYTVRLLFICDLSSSSAAAGARTAAVATRRVVERGMVGVVVSLCSVDGLFLLFAVCVRLPSGTRKALELPRCRRRHQHPPPRLPLLSSAVSRNRTKLNCLLHLKSTSETFCQLRFA